MGTVGKTINETYHFTRVANPTARAQQDMHNKHERSSTGRERERTFTGTEILPVLDTAFAVVYTGGCVGITGCSDEGLYSSA